MMTDTVRSRPVLLTLMVFSLMLSPLLATGALSAAAEEPPDKESSAAGNADATAKADEGRADESDGRDQPDQGNAGQEPAAASEQDAGEDEPGAEESAAASEQDAGEDEPGQAESDAADAEQGNGDGERDAGSGSPAESEPEANPDSSGDAASQQQGEPADEAAEEAEEDSEPAEEAQQRDGDPPHGNVGSVKVAPVGGEAAPPGTQPHIEGCAFDVLIYGRGNPDSVAVDIFAQSPTGDADLRTVTVELDGDAPAPGNELSGRATVDLESQLQEMAEAGQLDEHDQQGFHLKLSVDTPPQGGAKQKVFWLDCEILDEDGVPEEEQLEGELTVAKEVTGDAPAEPFEFVIACDDDEWTRTVAAGEASTPVTVGFDAEEDSASCTVTEVETHGADEVTVDGVEVTDDPQVTVEVDAEDSVETVFVNAFDDEDVVGDEAPPAGERPDGEGPPDDVPPEDAPPEDAPAEEESAGPPAEEEPSEVAPSDEAPEGDAPTDRPLFEAVAPEEAQREQAASEQTEREHVAAGADVQPVTAAEETPQLAATGLSLSTQLTVALVAIGAGAALLTVTSVRGRAWGDRGGGSV